MAVRIQRRITISPFRRWAVRKRPQRSPAVEAKFHHLVKSVKRKRICNCCVGRAWCRALRRMLMWRRHRLFMMLAISWEMLEGREGRDATDVMQDESVAAETMCNAIPKVMNVQRLHHRQRPTARNTKEIILARQQQIINLVVVVNSSTISEDFMRMHQQQSVKVWKFETIISRMRPRKWIYHQVQLHHGTWILKVIG